MNRCLFAGCCLGGAILVGVFPDARARELSFEQRVEAQVTALVQGMERSIAEADAFISKMGMMQ